MTCFSLAHPFLFLLAIPLLLLQFEAVTVVATSPQPLDGTNSIRFSLGSPSCYNLTTATKVQLSVDTFFPKVAVCFTASSKTNADILTVTYNIIEDDTQQPENEEWSLQATQMWLGNSAANIPLATRNGEDNEPALNFDQFPFQTVNLPSLFSTYASFATLDISSAKDLDFSCPNPSGMLVLASFHVTILQISTQTTFDLTTVDGKEGSTFDLVNALYLSCADDTTLAHIPSHHHPNQQQQHSPTKDPDKVIAREEESATLVAEPERHYNLRTRSRRTQNCPAIDPDPSTVKLSLSEDFFKRARVMLELAFVVESDQVGPIEDQIEKQREIYERFDGWSDCDDQALVAKTKDTGTCFAIFQGTDGANLLDQWQNVNPFTARVGHTDCIVRKGYHEGYFASYYTEFRQSVDDCVNSCSDGPCPLVVGGHSQGAAMAVVASIDLIQHDPELITIGGSRALVDTEPCTAINAKRHFRFVNTISGSRRYDYVPTQLNVYNEKQVGWPLYLDDLGNFPLGTTGFGDDNGDRFPFISIPAHERSLYMERIDEIINRPCFPLPVAGWRDGHYCRYDAECASNYCDNKACKTGLRRD